ncbi:hypothetical protein B7993_07190 [Fibrobacter sp. UWH3]|nr:hypothetical protein B7993_07190 [Fibrobacter sp. UWH3]SHK13271.1 methyltransferase, FkbM family [Fibrobacter sp. UWH6]
MIHSIRKKLQRNRFIIKVYSIFPWNKIIPTFKQFLFDLKMKKNGFIFRHNNLKPAFYLPYYKKDYIQKKIISEKNYYEFSYLKDIIFNPENGPLISKISQKCILDIGANIGNHTLFFLLECNASKVICFEPIKDTFRILKKNIEINNLTSKTELNNFALGAKTDVASISYYSKENIGSTSLKSDSCGNINISSLDDLHIQDEIAFIKIDVEGFELEVVKGMRNTLVKNHPSLMIEIRHTLFKDVNCILEENGYKYKIIETNDLMANYLYTR